MCISKNFPQFRHITADEIECRISNVTNNGLSLFIYKTARTDVTILNETVGAINWQCEYREIKGIIYCGVSIFDTEKNQWVTKWDCGEQSDFGDKNKGEASDAFKRACFKWGLGVELYTAPFIWIPNNKCNITGGKCRDRFYIDRIAIKDHIITGISIKNKNKKDESGKDIRVYQWYNKYIYTPSEPVDYKSILHVEDMTIDD